MMLRKIPALVIAFLLIDLLLVLAYLGSHFFYQYTGHLKMLAHYLDLDVEANLPSWYSSIQHFCVAILFALGIRHQVRLSNPKDWLLMTLPLMFVLFSLDEMAQLHEFVGDTIDYHLSPTGRTNTMLPETGIWMVVVAVPFLMLLIPFLISLQRFFTARPQVFQRLSLGLGVFLFGAIGVETLSNFVLRDPSLHFIEVMVEEGMEMVGVTLCLWAGYDCMQTQALANSAQVAADVTTESPALRVPEEALSY